MPRSRRRSEAPHVPVGFDRHRGRFRVGRFGRLAARHSGLRPRPRQEFWRAHVLRGLDLHVPAGRFLAVVGRSGCGKSTLLRLIAGLDKADAGRIAFGAGEAGTAREFARVMFQEPRLLPWASVISNVEVGLGAERRDPNGASACARGARGGRPRRPRRRVAVDAVRRAEAARRARPRAGQPPAVSRARRAARRARRTDPHRNAGVAGDGLAPRRLYRDPRHPRCRRSCRARRPHRAHRSGRDRPRCRCESCHDRAIAARLPSASSRKRFSSASSALPRLVREEELAAL